MQTQIVRAPKQRAMPSFLTLQIASLYAQPLLYFQLTGERIAVPLFKCPASPSPTPNVPHEHDIRIPRVRKFLGEGGLGAGAVVLWTVPPTFRKGSILPTLGDHSGWALFESFTFYVDSLTSPRRLSVYAR